MKKDLGVKELLVMGNGTFLSITQKISGRFGTRLLR